MCGIVGYIGDKEAKGILLDGLTRLEYRGYDSAGIAIAVPGETHLRRAEGKLQLLKDLVAKNELPVAHLGVGHTRWATHGRPSESNAHPHHYQSITIVHNGIIENYLKLRDELRNRGHHFSSETDSEILAHLISQNLNNGKNTLQAFKDALKKVSGSYAIAMINDLEPGKLYVARSGSPLVVGYGQGENFVASDIPALLPYTKEINFLEDGEVGVLDANEVLLESLSGGTVERKPKTIHWNLAMAEKGGYKHFMLKEIFEQPRALADTVRGHLQMSEPDVSLPELEKLFAHKGELERLDKIYLVACGTSWHAAQVARYYLEPWSRVLVQVDQASEFRYRNPLLDENTLVIAISQSGETADTLTAVRNAKERGAKVLTICNVVDSSLARESHGVLYTHAGPEIGVAATKTFTCQLAALQLLSLWFGVHRGGLDAKFVEEFRQALMEIPNQVKEILQGAKDIQEMALKFAHQDHCLFMGRGPQFPIALEGALKLKEISYLHAEGYSAGELKHGPIALIDRGSPLVALAPQDQYYEKMVSNIQEVLSRQASVLAVLNPGETQISGMVAESIFVPKTHPALEPILTVVPLQLFSYYIADHMGHDVDQPRNLAKSVTVE